jgi:hypothetical protein
MNAKTQLPTDQTEITLTLTVREINVLIAGLGKLPLEAAYETWGKIKGETERQLEGMNKNG